MTPYAATLASEETKELFSRIRDAVAGLPDLDLGTDHRDRPIVLSCHMLARAVGRVFGLRHADGLFARVFSHSWLLTPDGRWVIDCYPVGMLGGPVLVDASPDHFTSPGRVLYRQTRKFGREIPFRTASFRRSVRRIEREIRKCLKD